MLTENKVLVVGGGIAGLSLAISLRKSGVAVDIVELKKEWTVYGVGIIIQSNVMRAFNELGVLDKFMDRAYPFEVVTVESPRGEMVMPGHRLAGPQYPPNCGVSRPALHKVLTSTALETGTNVRLGVTLASYTETEHNITATFTDGSTGTYDLIVGADGTYSKVREMIFPEVKPRFTGQAVWRYNFPRSVDHLANYIGRDGLAAGLCPLAEDLMYMYCTSNEPTKPRIADEDLAAQMRDRLKGHTGGIIAELRDQITENKGVVYRPMEVVFVPEKWYKGRVVLIGDAAHSTSPHIGQGAGISVEDALVLGEELVKDQPLQTSLDNFMTRRYARCKMVCDVADQIGEWEMAGTMGDRNKLTAEAQQALAQPL
ncbi:FAD-dependent oxidoreductase [Hymenobacter caeli]|uniref:2-polyprenyl-6-methoxyphenol hydroxylase-like FAD-dependent oxidoreductase n=1 Tax=Hymenobacter caeli TaxID=2735894 RepID=A0ABX2FUZ7_9BACT|nr:FAD-dependent oxidoreductase [Hymenobacter caeli]NRT20816.1 2-polyprenyl-6-methoxyphenol hydroxylase-like FAD-dependent oxidoreductase [Hymenobacter caeli]